MIFLHYSLNRYFEQKKAVFQPLKIPSKKYNKVACFSMLFFTSSQSIFLSFFRQIIVCLSVCVSFRETLVSFVELMSDSFRDKLAKEQRQSSKDLLPVNGNFCVH